MLCRLEHVNVTEEYVFFIDADMLFLECVRSRTTARDARLTQALPQAVHSCNGGREAWLGRFGSV